MIVEDKLFDYDRLRLVVGCCMEMFYADDGLVGLQVTECLQVSFNVLMGIF